MNEVNQQLLAALKEVLALYAGHMNDEYSYPNDAWINRQGPDSTYGRAKAAIEKAEGGN